MTTPKLPFHEWLIVFLIILIFITLAIITSFHRSETPEVETSHSLIRSTLYVKIEGAVRSPGVYELERGACVEDAIQLAQPLPIADLKSLRLKKQLKDGQKIKVKEKALITIYLEGAVESSGPFLVPEGTLLSELGTFISLVSEADQTKLQKKKKLKNGDKVFIPFKKKNK